MKKHMPKSGCMGSAAWLATAFVVASVLALALGTHKAMAGHNPSRPQVSYDCDRFALKFYPEIDRWECAPAKSKIVKDTLSRIRQLKRAVDARIREIQVPTTKLDRNQAQRLEELIDLQGKLSRTLQQN